VISRHSLKRVAVIFVLLVIVSGFQVASVGSAYSDDLLPTYDDSINVLNEQSYPVVGGHWVVDFETRGTHDLIITPINGTTFGVHPDDIQFVSLHDGNGNTLSPQWVYNDDGAANSIRFQNYSSDKIGSLKILGNCLPF